MACHLRYYSLLALLVLMSACAPNFDPDGKDRCFTDDDCADGRLCSRVEDSPLLGTCAPAAGDVAITPEECRPFDVDGDGEITDEEMERAEKMIMIENEDKRQDAMRNMAWFSLSGMLLYPVVVAVASWLGLETAASILGDMAAVYFVSVAAIVAAFYGAQAYTSK